MLMVRVIWFIFALLYGLLANSSVAAQRPIYVTDSLGQHKFEQVPTRVAALSWDMAEQVLALEITPIAITDTQGYNTWVKRPLLPTAVVDVGARAEPNLSMLAQLDLDVIIVSAAQKDLLPKLKQIAPVLLYEAYHAEHNNAQVVVQQFKQLAQLFGRQQLAEQKLSDMYADIADMKQQLAVAFAGDLPKVSSFRFASLTSVYLFGDNSIAQHALNLLGFKPAIEQPASQWGVRQTRLKNLHRIDQGIALYFKPFAQEAKLEDSVMWQAMPFVRHGRVGSVESTWSYGGAMSIGYMAQALTSSLLVIAQEANQ